MEHYIEKFNFYFHNILFFAALGHVLIRPPYSLLIQEFYKTLLFLEANGNWKNLSKVRIYIYFQQHTNFIK